MREQVRIYKQINDYKNSKKKQTPSEEETLKKAYVSSRIVNKIAEDHIQQSLKSIITQAEQGKIDLVQD